MGTENPSRRNFLASSVVGATVAGVVVAKFGEGIKPNEKKEEKKPTEGQRESEEEENGRFKVFNLACEYNRKKISDLLGMHEKVNEKLTEEEKIALFALVGVAYTLSAILSFQSIRVVDPKESIRTVNLREKKIRNEGIIKKMEKQLAQNELFLKDLEKKWPSLQKELSIVRLATRTI